MKKAKYISNPFIYLSGLIFPIAGILITLIIKDFYALIFCVCVTIVYLLPIIILRKLMFRKMIINEEGITIYYRNSIVKQLFWEDIKDAKVIMTAQGGRILFSDKTLYSGKEEWRNWNCVFVNLKTSFAAELYKYIHKINITIKGFEKLPSSIKNKINQKKDNELLK